MSDLSYLFDLEHTNIDLPEGMLLCDDEDIVRDGDIVIDNNRETPFVMVRSNNEYSELIGVSALDARLSPLCYEVFRVKLDELY